MSYLTTTSCRGNSCRMNRRNCRNRALAMAGLPAVSADGRRSTGLLPNHQVTKHSADFSNSPPRHATLPGRQNAVPENVRVPTNIPGMDLPTNRPGTVSSPQMVGSLSEGNPVAGIRQKFVRRAHGSDGTLRALLNAHQFDDEVQSGIRWN